ncbi:MAG TPA: SRPBCC domain-containing protein [Stellaceae bacterium]|nr:SRPBCC domain-containing protein [Stellaceae bacterium]
MAAKSSSGAPMTERTVVITRIFDAARELVFEAWTNPVHLAAWFGPKGFTNPVCEVDLRIGGKLRIVMRAPDGAQHPMIGVFREIVRPERLVFTNIATNPAGKVLLEGLTTVTFAEHGAGQTKLTMESHAVARVDYASPMLEGMEVGWTQTIDRLGEYVATMRPGG